MNKLRSSKLKLSGSSDSGSAFMRTTVARDGAEIRSDGGVKTTEARRRLCIILQEM